MKLQNLKLEELSLLDAKKIHGGGIIADIIHWLHKKGSAGAYDYEGEASLDGFDSWV